MNCRANEEKVFPSESVKNVLETHFVEARLHTDGERGEELRDLQEEMVDSVASPYYIVIDPRSRMRETVRNGDNPFFEDHDGHLSAVGHRIIAEAVAKRLSQLDAESR